MSNKSIMIGKFSSKTLGGRITERINVDFVCHNLQIKKTVEIELCWKD